MIKESDLFQDEDRNNIGKLKKKTQEVTISNTQDEKKDAKVKRAVIGYNSQYDNILNVAEGNKTIIMDTIKLATCNICHDTAERFD